MILVLCFVLFIQNDKEPVMPWKETYHLTWNDFKAKPKYNTSAVATTASGITFGFSIKKSDDRVISFTTEVHAHFYPEQSWYKPEWADTHILGHEQLHFDITELFSRKFRKRISLLKTTNDVNKRLKTIQKSINSELAAFQNQYDSETDFSRNIEAQLQWEIFVEKELKKLAYYKSID